MLACNDKNEGKVLNKLSPGETGINFNNKLTYYDSLSVLEFVYMFNGAGVALIDINNDNLQDILFTGNMVSNRLYLNKGNLEFEDITVKAGVETEGWSNGVAVVDINQDGFQDFYICKAGNFRTPVEQTRNLFFINNGNNTFTESAAKMGLNNAGHDIQAAFFDYDKDGDLDMYLMQNAIVKYNRTNSSPNELHGTGALTDKMFRNNGNLTFSDVSKEAGITIEGYGLGLNICDINNDNWPDVYVSNDFITNDLMWINNKDGTFSNRAKECLRHETYNGMGNDVADFNNDGLQDIMVVDMLPPDNKRWKLTMMGNTFDEFQQSLYYGHSPQYVRNTLQLNNGDGSFSEIGMLAGVHATEWSWAPLFVDLDNDGWKDLFVTNGFRQDINNLDFVVYGQNIYGKKLKSQRSAEETRRLRLEELKKLPGIKVRNYIFRNDRNLKFTNVAEDWGMTDEDFSNGTSYGDLDNDGDLDLVINSLDGISHIYENRTSQINRGKAWLRVDLNGPPGNKDGLGAKVSLWQNGKMQFNYFSPYRGYLSSMEQVLHFGTDDGAVDSLKVVWPDGKEEKLTSIPTKQLITLDHKNAVEVESNDSLTVNSSLLTPLNDHTGIHHKHEEDYFVDFKVQALLPHMHSRLGPGISVADINSDGMDDFFCGAAMNSKSTLFLQQKNGKFVSRQFTGVNLSDNMGSLFFDADNDGDNDLYVSSGGSSTSRKNNPVYKHSMYVNDGRGNFTLLNEGFPAIATPASGVKGADFDRDGDLDLLVCGRVSSGEYPMPPQSFLLRNDSKKDACRFTDVTTTHADSLSMAGMISDALWTDFDNDGWVDIIALGEFMPVKFFKNENGRFRDVTKQTGLTHSNGWWNSLAGGDFDKDGDIDYVLGNLGLNGPYKASAKEPVCIYAGDYDKNGRLDPVMCHFMEGKEYTVHSRDDINRQMTAMRGRFKTYDSYAKLTFQQAMRDDEISNAYVVKAERFENSYMENLGGGKFRISALPLEAQFSPLFGMYSNDFDNDGNLDVLAVGNSFSTEVQTGRYDAQGSLILKGDGKGKFLPERTVFNIPGDNKSIAPINLINGTSAVIIGANSDSLRIFGINAKFRTIALLPNESYVIIVDKNNRSYRQEVYYGHSYLSQGSRSLEVPLNAKSATIYSYSGAKREFNF